jgi:hypothetical protein
MGKIYVEEKTLFKDSINFVVHHAIGFGRVWV